MKRLLTIILLLTAIMCTTATAETVEPISPRTNLENIPTQFLNAENGLAGETVTNIISDLNGQKWIATSNGVNHYNGVRMVNVPIPKKQAGKNYVFDICADDDGCIYIATDYGIFQLRKNGSAFTHILPSIGKVETILAAGGKVYAGNRDGLTVTDGKVVERTISVGPSPMSIENGMRDIQCDSKGNIWFTSRYAVNCYSPKTGRVTSANLSAQLPQRAALSSLALCGDRIYVGTKNNGLYAYTLATKAMKRVDGIGNIISSLCITRHGELAVGTAGSGAFLLSTKTDGITASYGTSGKGKHYLPTDVVYCYYKDDDGIDWFGFHRYGMAHTYKNEHLFNTYSHGSFTTEGLNVKSFYVHDNIYLLGTANELTLVDENRNLVKNFTPQQLGGTHIITDFIFYNGYYYVASYDCGLHRINSSTLEVSDIPGQPLLKTITIGALALSPDGKLWIGTSEGLFIMDAAGTINQYTENNSSIIGSSLLSIYFDSKNNGWVCGAQGLSYYAQSAGIFESKYPEGFFNKEYIFEVSRGKDGKVFFASRSGIYYSEEQQVNDRRQIRLSWNFASQLLTVKTALNDFARPYGRLFEYRIDGEKQWHVTHAGETVMLRTLLPGSHTLDVRLAGVPATMRTYSIVVVPSAMAWIELVMLLTTVILFILWRRSRKYTKTLLEERNDIETALIEVEAEQQKLEVKVEQQKQELEAGQQKPEVKAEAEKYKGIKINGQECEEIVVRMKRYLEQTKRYTEQEMKMSDLADHLHLSSSRLSMVFNLYLKENYYEFINRYRLEEFKRLIGEGAASRYTIIALSEKCGFKKSNFFSTFRKIEGMTPTEYLKKHNVAVRREE